MASPSEKISLKNRLIIYAILLSIAAILILTDTAAGFFKGFAGGLLIAVLIGESALYLRRRNVK